jgi:hypothetical protein
MSTNNFLIRLFHPQIPCLAIITLIALACGTPAFCGEIHDAARKGNLKKVKTLLEKNPELVSSKDSESHTPLHWAVHKKDVVELLLAHGADVNAKAKNGITPLHMAVMVGGKDVVELLLAKGAAVNARDQSDATPLHNAAMAGKDAVELLLSKGAEVNAKDFFGRTPLQVAFQAANKDVIKLLLDKGADDTGIGAAIMIEKDKPPLPTIPGCEVTAHPEKYVNERIQVRAIFRTGFEWSEIYSLRCVDSKSTWLEFSPMVQESSSRRALKQMRSSDSFFSITVGVVLEGRLTGVFGVTHDHGLGQ